MHKFDRPQSALSSVAEGRKMLTTEEEKPCNFEKARAEEGAKLRHYHRQYVACKKVELDFFNEEDRK